MKLHELAVTTPTKQIAKVFEEYFGDRLSFDQISGTQARSMLQRVRGLINEHRRQPAFHQSEKNPAYLKLLMMEQGLSSRLAEQMAAPMAGATPAQQGAAGAMAANVAAAQKFKDPKMQAAVKKAQMSQTLNKDEQAMLAAAALMPQESKGSKIKRRMNEASEVQQAQVILASKDMVDQVQKMIEQTTSIQFKDLPALVDQIRNEVGYDQATQFNTDATAALSGMVQNLQGAKGQLEVALGVVTGQAPQVPGADMATAPGAEPAAQLPAPDEEEIDVDAELDAVEPEGDLEASLGRGKR